MTTFEAPKRTTASPPAKHLPVKLDPTRVTRADLHAHTWASSAPVIPLLGRIDMPECYSPPERVYEQAKARGMDLVAITDHDTIRGAMELVDRGFDDVIVGEEVTVFFPEDRCKLHVLVWGLDWKLHESIERLGLRDDVYAFAAWVRQHELPHALAHPLYVQNKKFTAWHLERAALLFKGFETLNGAHSGTHRDTLLTWLDALTPARVQTLIDKHAIEPLWSRIWSKAVTGGSDDHGLLNVGRAWTAVPSPEAGHPLSNTKFLQHVMAGHSTVGGQAGHSAALAHQLTSVGFNYLAEQLHPRMSPRSRMLTSRLVRFAGIDAQRPSKLSLIIDTAKKKLFRRRTRGEMLVSALREHLEPLLEHYPEIRSELHNPHADGPPLADHERMSQFTDELSERLARAMGSDAINAFRTSDKTGIVDALTSYGFLVAAQLPHIFSLFHQNKERRLLREIEQDVTLNGGPDVHTARVMLFTDTLGDVNGVCRFIQNMGSHADNADRAFKIVTSTRLDVPDVPYIANFDPVFAAPMPKYSNLEVTLPPVLRMLRLADQFQPDAIHISTPGTVGFVGLIAARMLRVPIVGTYHTDFPAYVDHLFDDPTYTKLTTEYMRFFYKRFKRIFTRSDDYMESLEGLGITRDRMTRLTPGVALESFTPAHRDTSIWPSYGAKPKTVKVLYCGRVSVEKNLPLLTRIWPQAREIAQRSGVNAELIVIGDGPYRKEMERELRNHGAHFLGFRRGRELSTLYASSDMFIFPSNTDTLGQVVMESQASGIPVIVSDQGGPKEVVDHAVTGFVLPGDTPDRWRDQLARLIVDEELRTRMGRAAHTHAQQFSLSACFEQFWGAHVETARNGTA